ncbi:hypothetical protein ASZ90_019910 [hydrocarbon metagenome]|uniref:Helix-turn-helix domain-containing protein n=1 Tax=hydrocarbon metagenome TaxID=938273 RepID=A0A0W8E249_9ZZZZ
MLTVSQIAERFNISNRQVHNLVERGYLNVTHLYRNNNQGVTYLFSEEEIADLDIYSLLAEVQGAPARPKSRPASSFKQVIGAVRYYDRFLENISNHPEDTFLRCCFYLFHLNHYAKTYHENSNHLYRLKNQVIQKLYQENPSMLSARYLTGPDRYRVWLCEDCKDSAESSGMSYAAYIKNEYFCPKCSLHSVEKEYYSLIEFRVKLAEYKFTFHLPLASAERWMENLADLPQNTRKTGSYIDRMYLYGRPATPIEEQVFPINMIINKLENYLVTGKC